MLQSHVRWCVLGTLFSPLTHSSNCKQICCKAVAKCYTLWGRVKRVSLAGTFQISVFMLNAPQDSCYKAGDWCNWLMRFFPILPILQGSAQMTSKTCSHFLPLYPAMQTHMFACFIQLLRYLLLKYMTPPQCNGGECILFVLLKALNTLKRGLGFVHDESCSQWGLSLIQFM